MQAIRAVKQFNNQLTGDKMSEYVEITKYAMLALLNNKPSDYLTDCKEKHGAIFEDFKNLGVELRAVYQNGICQYYIRDINA